MSLVLHIECYPITTLPHLSRLFTDYAGSPSPLAPFYRSAPCPSSEAVAVSGGSLAPAANADSIADLLAEQNRAFLAGARTLENIEKLRTGARAVVTGQQVTLFGGPLYTILKAAAAIRRARESGAVPIFWLASEDHDLEEADHVTLPARRELRTLRLEHAPGEAGRPVGGVKLGAAVVPLLDQAAELLGSGAALDALRAAYKPDATYAEAFARFMAASFADQGLILIDASSRGFHRLGAPVLRAAIERAAELESLLLERKTLLASRGYAAQVMVARGGSLLFLVDGETGMRLALKRGEGGEWIAGAKPMSTAELLAILDSAPERLSPSALLRPVFQDAILPTSAYIGGPSEVAYFAQSQVLYEAILGRTTPVLPRLSATLVDAQSRTLLERYNLSLKDLMSATPDETAQRLGERLLPAEGRAKLQSAGAALDAELTALTQWIARLDPSLGQSAESSASKMRYQMGRLRRLASTYILQKDASLMKQLSLLYRNLIPDGRPQERVFGGCAFLARYGGGLTASLVEAAGDGCPAHKAIFLD